MNRLIPNACIILVLLFVVGCGKGKKIPPLAAVEGRILDQDGNPLEGIRVQFLPDPEKEVFGAAATGETDAQGKFILYYEGNKKKPGTAIGINRVVLQDIKAMRTSRDPEPILRRFHQKYVAAKTTDLRFDVKDEEGQSFDIKVDLPEDG